MKSCLLFSALVLYHQGVVLLAQHPSCDDSSPRTACAYSTSEECIRHGCCWSSDANDKERCYFQRPKYMVKSISNITYGVKMVLVSNGTGSEELPASPISPLTVEFIQETQDRLHIKIMDPNKQRWEIPESILPVPPPPTKPVTFSYTQLKLPAENEEFYFTVIREYYNTTIFDTKGIEFFFGNQFLKIGTNLPQNYNIYGLGDHKTSFKLQAGKTYTLWNYDTPDPKDINLYGSHPFYMEVRNGFSRGISVHGVFLRSSNGMDVELGTQSLTYSVNGGILDLYILVGFTPDDLIENYHEVIGRPAMPPYWALGFHQSRWGYNSIDKVKTMVEKFAENKIPLDGVWSDIDYMDKFKDFTTDPVNFPKDEMRLFVDKVHNNGQHYVMIVDPGISTSVGYKPYDDGMGMNIFIKDRDNKVFVGLVWPGYTAFPDFLNPLTTEYWKNQISSFLAEIPVDGLWIDMNEPSNFCNGFCHKSTTTQSWQSSDFDPVNPPYSINNHGNKSPLNTRTIDMDALHYDTVAYNVHNLYGLAESQATYRSLLATRKNKRPFVLSRSTFPGSGSYAAHWLGDNSATEEDMYYSIPGILNFQMFGVPLVGADICGFQGPSTEELCARWMQLGAFYPFSRNHNYLISTPQEPYHWSTVAAISRKYLSIRYSLLPYYYTLFFKAHHDPTDYAVYPTSGMVVKPLFFEFLEEATLSIDTQFLVGEALLICPQLKLGDDGTKLKLYLPGATWYDWYTRDAVTDDGNVNITVDTPLDTLPIYIRGGYIIPMQDPGLTTTESRKNPYSLLVALIEGRAEGSLYLDDGETFNTTDHTFITYDCNSGELSSDVSGTQYATKAELPLLTTVTVLGVINRPTIVVLDGKPVNFTFTEGNTFKMTVGNLSINMDTEFHLGWM